MVAFVIFGASALSLLFFALGFIFKGIAAVFDACLAAIYKVCYVMGIAALVGVGIYAFYSLIDAFISKGFWPVVGILLLYALGIFIVVVFGAQIAVIVVQVIYCVVTGIIVAFKIITEWFSEVFEKAYTKFLTIIINNLDKC